MATIRLITDPAEFAELAPLWDNLLERSARPSLFQSWDWLAAWVETYVPSGRLFAVVVYHDGLPVAVAPLWCDRERLAGMRLVRTLRFLGSGEACADHLDIILQRSSHGEWLAELWNALWQTHGDLWDVLDLGALPVDSPTLDFIRREADSTRRCLAFSLLDYETCPYLPLPESWTQFMSDLTKSRRYAIGMSRKRLSEQAPYSLDWCQRPEQIEPWLAELAALNTEIWQARGHPGSFSTATFKRFHRLLSARLLARDQLILCAMRQDGAYLGSLYGMRYQGTVYNYIFTVRRNAEARVSNGDVLLSEVLEAEIAKGARELDFLRGDEGYKQLWTPHSRRQVTLRLFNRSVRSLALNVSVRAREVARAGWRFVRR